VTVAAAEVEGFDVVVLGCGSGGEAVAPPLAGAGLRVAVVEAGRLGGACPYVACMPSKALLVDAARGVPWERAVRRRDEVTAGGNDAEVAERFAAAGIEVVRGEGVVTAAGRVEAAGRTLGYRWLVLNTGSRPAVPPVDGLERVPTWDSEQALTAARLPGRLAILGGGPVGCELAQLAARFGSAVTLVEPAPRLLPGEPEFVGALLADVLRHDGVDVRTGAQARRAQRYGSGLRLELSAGGGESGGGGESTVEADRVLLAAGRAPVVHGIGLERLGIDVDSAARDGLPVDDRCRVVGAAGVFAVGDVTGVAPFTHTATYQGRLVADIIVGRDRVADYRAVPRVLYTSPAVCAVGLTPQQAADRGLDLAVAGMDLAETARAQAEGDTPPGPPGSSGGRVELYADRRRGVLVGGAAVGPAADSWLAEVVLAVRAEVPAATYADVIHAFPAWGEALEPPLRRLAADCAAPVESGE